MGANSTAPRLLALAAAVGVCWFMINWYLTLSACGMLAVCLQTPLLLPHSAVAERVGAYFQTSLQHAYAAQVALTAFRRAYPSGPIFAYVDVSANSKNKYTNDQQLQKKLQKLQNFDWDAYAPVHLLSASHTKNKSAASLDSASSSASASGTHFGTVAACTAYVSRIIRAAQQLDWLVLLEDDVWVCNRFDAQQQRYDMNGQCIAKYDVRVWGRTAPGQCYGGCGGFVLRGSFLRRMQINEAYIQSMLDQIQRPIASDELLSALFLRSNGTIGHSPAFAERMTPHPRIVHQMKSFYVSSSSLWPFQASACGSF